MIERTYFEDDNFVLSVFSGRLTDAELRQHVMDMNAMFRDKDAVNELADCRFLKDVSQVTAPGAALSAEMQKGQRRSLGSRGAIVAVSNVVYGLANAYAMFSQEARDDSRVFRSLDEAIDWLEVTHLREEIVALSSKFDT